jgi:hypothetical protein
VHREDSGSQKEAGVSGHSECKRHGLSRRDEASSEQPAQPERMSPNDTRLERSGEQVADLIGVTQLR